MQLVHGYGYQYIDLHALQEYATRSLCIKMDLRLYMLWVTSRATYFIIVVVSFGSKD